MPEGIPMLDTRSVEQTYSKDVAATTATRTRYNRLAPIYDLMDSLSERLSTRFKRQRLWSLVPPGQILEIGVGTGKNMPYYPMGAQVIAVDPSDKMLTQARKRVERHGWRNVELIEAGMTRFELPKGIDGILSTYAMSAIPRHDTVIKRCAQALRDRGRLVILDFKRVGRIPLSLTPVWMLLSKPFEGGHSTSQQEPWKEMRKCLTDVQIQESRLGFVYLVSGARKVGMRNDRSW
jgi:demethylmenaquinone methyltransferase/2-methoxy-6-polyprenyl-1,4-benzoquinol methylase